MSTKMARKPASDTVYFDENSKGIWEVKETVRKAYLTFKRG